MANQLAGTIVWNLDVDDSKFQAGIKKAKDATTDLGKDVDTKMSGVKNSIVSAFENAAGASTAFAAGLGLVATGITTAAGFGIKYAADLETMRAGFVTLLGSTEKANAAIKQIQKDAATTPFTFPGLVSANQLLTSVTKNSDDSERLLLNVGKALTAMGKGQPELDRIIVNLQQIGAIGHASAVDIKQFAYAGIPIYDLLNEKLKTTKAVMTDNSKAIGDNSAKVAELQQSLKVAQLQQKEFTDKTKESTKVINQNKINKYTSQIAELTGKTGTLTASNGKLVTSQQNLDDAISSGTITFDLLKEVFNEAGEGSGRFAKAFQEQGGTFNQVFSNLQDNIGITSSRLVESLGIFNLAKQGLVNLTDAAQYLASDAGIAQLNGIFSKIVDNLPIFIGLILGGLTPAFFALATQVGIALIALAPFLLIGAAIGGAVQLVVTAMGGWDKARDKVVGAVKVIIQTVDDIKKKFQDLAPLIKGYIDITVGQFSSFGERTYDAFNLDPSKISFSDFFSQLSGKILPFIDEIVTQVQQGFKNAFKINFGDTGGIVDLFGRLVGIFQTVTDILLRTLTPAFDTFNKALVNSKPQLDVLLQQLGPIFINGLQILAGAIAAVVVVFIGLFSGIVQAVSFALPFVIQAFAGFAQIISGIMDIIVGIFTLNFEQVWQGIKTTFLGIFNLIVGVLGAILGAIVGFVKGVIDFFVQLYNVLVGHSIVPDMVNAIWFWFAGLPQRIYDAIVVIITQIPQVFTDAWTAVTNLVDGWVTDVFNWGERIAKSFVDGFGKLGGWLKDKIEEGLNYAKSFIKGDSPPPAGPFKDIDKWGFNVGSAWADGVSKAIGVLSLPAPALPGVGSAPALAYAQPQGGGRQGPLINIEEMSVRDQSDITDIGRELAFRVETSSGYTDNG